MASKISQNVAMLEILIKFFMLLLMSGAQL
jgi:hypothetical protein